MSELKYHSGFTLLETIIYVGLFGLIFSGIFASIYPFLTGSEKISSRIAAEGESAFIIRKIRHALNEGVTTPDDVGDIIPKTGNTDGESALLIGEDFSFIQQGEIIFYARDGGAPTALNADRVPITDFLVTHPEPEGQESHHLEISFTAGGQKVGPITYNLHF